MPACEEIPGGVRLKLHLRPGAKQDAVCGFHGDAIKIMLKAPPVEGKANQALRRFIAERCGVPSAAVSITSGQQSRDKTVTVAGVVLRQVTETILKNQPVKLNPIK